MIHIHSLDRGSRYYAERLALYSGGTPVTFRKLCRRVEGIAAALRGHGFAAGDRLAMLLPNSPEFIELVYACAWLGLVAVPLNTRLSVAEIDRILVDATPHGLVRHSSLPAPTERVPWSRVLDQESLEVVDDSCPEILYAPEALLALIYTSGTTGRPKGVMVSHGNVLSDVHHFSYWMTYKEGGVYLHAAPMFHIADFPAMFAAPAFGAAQVTIPKFSPSGFCETVQRERVTHTVLVPTMINLLAEFADIGKYDLSSLEVLAYGGSPMSPELIRRTRDFLPGTRLVQVYGLSETGFLTGLQDREHIATRLSSCGRPSPGVDLRVVDDSGKELGTAQAGELVARGSNITRGYWRNSEETANGFRNGMFRTGDIGYQDKDGFFYVLDRLKDMIVTGGENVYSEEVEAVLSAHPAVREAAVFGIPDSRWGELVTASVVLRPGASLDVDEIIGWCRKTLAGYKVPRRIEFSETELPKNGSGKVLKRQLRDRFWTHHERAVS